MSLNWDTLDVDTLVGWIAERQDGLPPDAFMLRPSAEVASNLFDYFAPLTREVTLRRHSGGIAAQLTELASPDTSSFLFDLMATAAADLDSRRERVSPHPISDEEPADGYVTSVAREYWLPIEGVLPVGPGGRMTYYQSSKLLEMAIHFRSNRLAGVWRDPDRIAVEILTAFDGAVVGGERLRATFGYYESSLYVSQTLLRPVYVAMVERLERSDGPRWRLTSVHAATDIPNIPLTAGINANSIDPL